MSKRSGVRKVFRVPQVSSYPAELQKRVSIIGVSLLIILVLIGIGLYVAPGEFVGRAILGAAEGSVIGSFAQTADNTVEIQSSMWFGRGIESFGLDTHGFCRSSDFCVLNRRESGSIIAGRFCYTAGSIVQGEDVASYCQQSFDNREYVWISCNQDNAGWLTEESDFICADSDAAAAGGERWVQCTTEGEVQGNYVCDSAGRWQQCGEGTPHLCAGRSTVLECGAENKYETDSFGEYYCAYSPGEGYQWVHCTSETLGEGVDNAPHAERYGDNYICAVQEVGAGGMRIADYKWLPIPNCAACAGDREGSCMGSSTIDFRTGEPISGAEYYSSGQIATRVGCAGANECYTNGREYAVDEAVHSRTICGGNNAFLRCTDGAVAVPSDGGTLLCLIDTPEDANGDGTWERCDETKSGLQIDNFICSYNPDSANPRWQWYSEFSCSPSQKYQVRDLGALSGAARICDGTSWITCEDLAVRNPFTDPAVDVTCSGNSILVNENICNNNVDDDHDGLVDCRDTSLCSPTQTKILNENKEYEYILKHGDCFNADIDMDEDDLEDLEYTQLSVCDSGTTQFGNRVTLCEDAASSGTDTPILTLDSTALLQNRFGQPYHDANNLAFLFKESTPKAVSIMLYRDISEAERPLTLPLRTFANNFAAGQRVMLAVDGEAYLLWHPLVDATHPFSETNLKLTHIATGTEIPAVVFPGTNRYTFDLMGDRLLTFYIDTPLVEPENQIFVIQALAPGEAPQSFPIPTNLYERFEVTFSKINPVRFIEPSSLGTFSVCRDDNSADPQQVKVCQKDFYNRESYFTLQARTLTERAIGDYTYAFLFEVANNTKQVSIFPFHSLGRTATPLSYDAFINSMVAGRRIALKFNDKLYLLRHPVQAFISLPSLTLTRYLGSTVTTFPAVGSPDLVDFLTSEGKIHLARTYGDPPPPFGVSALRIEEIAPVDLDADLSTAMSSLVPVTLETAVVRADDAVYRVDERMFQLSIGGTSPRLEFRVPTRWPENTGDALFYYHSVTPSEGALVKQVAIYKLYDLTSGSTSRAYDAAFVETFARGKEFALLLGGNYYLMRYENNNNEVLSFNINRVRLSTLDRSVNIVAIPDGAGIRFDLPDGRRLAVRVNYQTNMLEFNTGADVLAETAFEAGDYMRELTTSNSVTIGDGDARAGVELRLCRLTAYNALAAANVCTAPGASGPRQFDLVVNPLPQSADEPAIITVGSGRYLLETNGRTGNDKKVFIRRLFTLAPGTIWPPAGTLYWFDFAEDVANASSPYFELEDAIYVPHIDANAQLQTFGFHPYGRTERSNARNVVANTPIAFNASYVLQDRIVKVVQRETSDEERPVSATFLASDLYYPPEDGEPLILNSSLSALLSFLAQPDGVRYDLSVIALGGGGIGSQDTVRLQLSSSGIILIDRLFAEQETRILHLGSVIVQLTVESIADDGSVRISVGRV